MLTSSMKQELARFYDAGQWAQKAESGRRILVRNFFMAGSELPGWNLVKSLPEQALESRRFLTYLWRASEDQQDERIIRVDIVECPSWRSAHDSLIELLGEYQGPRLTEADSRKVQLGDIGYLVPGDIPQGALFARANMVVRVRSIERRGVAVTVPAAGIDALFATEPQVSEKGVIPEIARFDASRSVVRKEERVQLQIETNDPLGRPVWYKLVATQGELRAEDSAITFVSEETGTSEIRLYAINENCFVARALARVTVE